MPPRWSLDSSSVVDGDEDISCSSPVNDISHPSQSFSTSSDSSQQDEESREPSSDRNEARPQSPFSDSANHSPKKSVRFAEFATIHLYSRSCYNNDKGDDASSSSSCNTWYSPQELKSFRMDTIATIDLIVSGKVGDNDSPQQSSKFVFCSRGCEIRTPMGTVVRQKHRMDSLRAVFQYQDECRLLLRQWKRRTGIIAMIQQQQQLKSGAGTQRRHNSSSNRTSIRLTDVMNPLVVARLYSAHTQQSQQKARFRGELDQQSTSGVERDSSPSCTESSRTKRANNFGACMDSNKLDVQKREQHKRHDDLL